MRLLLLVFGFVSTFAHADAFRGLDWSATTAQIKANEKGAVMLGEAPNGIIYKDSILGMESQIIYLVSDGMLIRGVIKVKQPHSNPDSYIDDFKKLDQVLKDKYGKPEKEQEAWMTDSSVIRSKPGLAVQMGKLMYVTSWESENLRVEHALSGDNYKAEHVLHYVNPKTLGQSEQDRKDKAKGKL